MKATAPGLPPISVEEYLDGESQSPVKHEYLGGTVHAMAGGSNAHNLIATNLTVALGSRLRGGPCRVYNSDTKIRLRLPSEVRFYYPDGSVVCRPNPPTDSFQDDPLLVAEVVSRTSRRTDEGEKKDAYLTIPSLSLYLLIEQDSLAVVVFRRGARGFSREDYVGLEALVRLDEIGSTLPLSELYDGVAFGPEPGGQ
jgi:Uma2 family endonuclease